MLCTLGSLKMFPCLLGASIIYEFLQIPTDIFISCGCLFLIWLHWVWLSLPPKYQSDTMIGITKHIFYCWVQVFFYFYMDAQFCIFGFKVDRKQ